MGKRYVVRLTGPERAAITQVAHDSERAPRVRLWAAIILAASAGECDQAIATDLATSVATVQRTRRRFALEGLACLVPVAAGEMRTPVVVGSETWVRDVLRRARGVDGAQRAAILDWQERTCVGQVGTRDREWWADAEALWQAILRALPSNERLENATIIASTHYQLFHVLSSDYPMVLNVVVNRHEGTLAFVRHQVEAIAQSIVD